MLVEVSLPAIMMEKLDLEEEKVPSGFRRYKAKYRSIHRPWQIIGWLNNPNPISDIPRQERVALRCLDRFAKRQVPIDRSRMRTRNPVPKNPDRRTTDQDKQLERLFCSCLGSTNAIRLCSYVQQWHAHD